MLRKTLNTFLLLLAAAAVFASGDYWVKPMQEVHKKFTGTPGSVRLCGDSITEAAEFWDPVQYVETAPDFDLKSVKKYIEPGSWQVKGSFFGNLKGWTINNGMGVLDLLILKKQNPEACIVMFGTNDLEGGAPSETGYDKKLRLFIDKILKNGTVAIMSTIPPKRDKLAKVEEYNKEIRKIALEKYVPLIELYEEILFRQPEKWDGELISDGTHLTWNSGFNKFDEASLKKNGNMTRNYATFKTYAEVYEKIFKKQK